MDDMGELQTVLAGPVKKTFGDEEITFAQFTFDMLREFETWAKGEWNKRRKAEIKERLDDLGAIPDLSPFDRGKLGLEVYNSARLFDLAEAMYTLDGAVQLLALSAKVDHPAMTVERMRKLLPFQIETVHGLIDELTPVGPVSPQEQRDQQVRDARGRLESAVADKDGEGCRAKLDDAIKMLYKALDEQQPGAPSPPADPASA